MKNNIINHKTKIVLIFFNLIIILIAGGCGGEFKSTNTNEKLSLSHDDQKTIDLAVSEGYIRLVPNLNEVWVKPEFWNTLPFESKKNLGAMSAIYCANKKGTDLYWVNVIDNHSGKKLAKWSKSWGFEVY